MDGPSLMDIGTAQQIPSLPLILLLLFLLFLLLLLLSLPLLSSPSLPPLSSPPLTSPPLSPSPLPLLLSLLPSFLFLVSSASPNLPVVCFPLQGENWQLQGGAAWSIPWTWRPSQARKNQGLPFPVLDHQTVSSSSSILFPSLPPLSCLLSHVVPIVLCLANILILYCASWCHVV